MRTLSASLLLTCLLASGCEWLQRKDKIKPPGPAQPVSGGPKAEQLVRYINQQADQLSVIQTEDVDLWAFVDKVRQPGLRGVMVCEKPRNFRLQGDAVGQTHLDIGSNDERFWFWMKNNDLYYCSYTDYEKGVKLPMPFQPEWVVQALGMAKLDPNKNYSVKTNADSYELIEETTVQGQPVRKITIFARQARDETYPWVTGHIIQDARTNATICQASVRRMRVAKTADNKRISYPSHVVLEWPAEKLVIEMKIGAATVNQKLTSEDASRWFTVPNMQGIKAVDLAREPIMGSPTGRDLRQTGGYR